MTELAVRCVGLGKAYRRPTGPLRWLQRLVRPAALVPHEHWAVRGLDLEVPRGAVFGLVGRNGAGKSTTLKMIAGLLRPTTGVLEVKGHVSSILELGTGLNPSLTGRQNARINALFLGLDPWRIEAQLERVLEFAELGDYVDEPLAHYSSGMRARLAFAVLTALDPDILVLDEALAAGDTAFATKCQRFVRDLCRSGCTTLLVSHDLHFLESSCDAVAWVDHGAVRAVGSPGKVVEEYLVATVGGTPHPRQPRRLHVRFQAPADAPVPVEVSLHQLVTLDAQGRTTSGMDLGRFDAWNHALEMAAEVGLTSPAAIRGWGEVQPAAPDRPAMRPLRLAAGEDGHLIVPLAPGADLPEVLRVTGRFSAARLPVAIAVDGVAHAIGHLGGEGQGDTADLGIGHLLRGRQAT